MKLPSWNGWKKILHKKHRKSDLIPDQQPQDNAGARQVNLKAKLHSRIYMIENMLVECYISITIKKVWNQMVLQNFHGLFRMSLKDQILAVDYRCIINPVGVKLIIHCFDNITRKKTR